MKRVLLDTNAVNRIADRLNIMEEIKQAYNDGELIIIGNPMVRHELELTVDETRKAQLVATYDALPRRDVVCSAGIYGIGLKYGQAKYGDGSHTGISLSQARTKGRGRARDAVIAVTAAGEADFFVTDDSTLAEKVMQSMAPCTVWDFDTFKTFLTELSRARDQRQGRGSADR
jgi:hypothetical protein